MSHLSVKVERRNILDGIYELEKKLKTRIPLPQKLLFAATGNLEKTISLLTGSETAVRILEQIDLPDVISRSICIVLKENDIKLVNARSNIYPSNLPEKIVKRIRKRHESIGDILDSEGLEIFKSITNLGYDPINKCYFKVYNIIFKSNIAISIEEYFEASLNEQINLGPSV
jgi:chorismate-pyruvate lyase